MFQASQVPSGEAPSQVPVQIPVLLLAWELERRDSAKNVNCSFSVTTLIDGHTNHVEVKIMDG